MPAGRPTEYTPEILEEAEEYLAESEDEEVQQTIGLSAKGTELYKNKLKVSLPSIEGLARYLDVHRDTLYEWAKLHPEFSDILEAVRAEQAQRLINSGLSGDYNPTIAKLLLTKHGYSDKQETDVTSGGQPVMLQWQQPQSQSHTLPESGNHAYMNPENAGLSSSSTGAQERQQQS